MGFVERLFLPLTRCPCWQKCKNYKKGGGCDVEVFAWTFCLGFIIKEAV